MVRRNTLGQRDLILKVCRPVVRFARATGLEPAGIKKQQVILYGLYSILLVGYTKESIKTFVLRVISCL